ncbi:hypothetical protein FT663_00034 [Candidozyma haemuli var. vulneris]|uniref:Peroxisomal ATPase PEX1 n=1 Tax=Candidozyma haemuli TaxID=45357 RepID=A0A2V1AYB5_9ASCO|nr:hypothetical protein CXQ85_000823 [[Candida] haemuloni]KAF3994014.1 hypothetical protein FT662_00200 [[Candida] haemuloni var. vulneris]KAF3995811.1 hypothetical protein FT663_00034 [[Candida] haemuloni var. vulneris]PVH21831.1 hypothetical protein CXQ85_000823 [[Candida] haemuloni]
MEGSAANIVFRQSWNNLVDLPANLSSLLYNANVSPQEVVVELVTQAQNKCYVGWSGMSAGGARNLGIDSILAQSLRLAEKQLVTVNVKIRNFKASSIFLEPEHSSDWELVELHAAYIESKLIEQSRCVAVGQVLVVYPTKTSSVKLQVKDIGSQEHSYAIIDPFAEISIAPKLREKKRSSSQSVKSGRSSRSTVDEASLGPSVLKRGIALPNKLFTTENTDGYTLHVNFEEVLHVFNRAEFVTVSVLPGPDTKINAAPSDTPDQNQGQDDKKKDKNSSKAVTENKTIVARIVNSPKCPANTVGLSQKLANALNVEHKVGFKVAVRQAPKHVSKRPSTLIVHPYITQTKKTESIQLNSSTKAQKNQNLAQNISKVLFDPEVSITKSPITNLVKIPPIPAILPLGAILEFKKNSDTHAWIKPYELTGSKNPPKIEIGDDVLRSASFLETDEPETLDEVYGSNDVIEEIVDYVTTFPNSGIMLHGTSGSGKTLLLKWIARKLGQEHGVHTKVVSCESFMNENYDQLSANFTKWIQDCSWNDPSVLILDNLDKVLSAEVEQGDSTLSNQLSEFLISQIQKIHSQNNTNLSLIVSGISKEAFNKLLGMMHLVESYYHLSPPQKNARATILDEYLIKKLGCKVNFDLMDIVSETEGYLPNDLKLLSDRIFHESLFNAASSEQKDQYIVDKASFEKALSGFMPSNLRGVKLQKSSTSWADIGGLTEAKRVLLETLEWPTKYAPIFANCPLRLRSGILLYGYPGCGKTLLASAIAGQCGLNFISIKGPEILNKYIGASEQSVRELFERAQSAKPCILFFDEFDSIAPKRGHDSTGVTDRVVNQMLTQMDGAEGLDGVYVLAATSRPDLIDSALLRPGRLDKSIICDMPNYDDRLDILKCISAKMDLSDDVNLEDIAQNTGGFSGADMQGLGYNAYLKAVHEKLAATEALTVDTSKDDKSYDFFQVSSEKLKSQKIRPAEKVKVLQQIEKLFEDEKDEKKVDKKSQGKENSKVILTQEHFLESLKETKPSISASEKTKLQRVYTQFLTGRDGTMPDGSASNEVGGRTTLM